MGCGVLFSISTVSEHNIVANSFSLQCNMFYSLVKSDSSSDPFKGMTWLPQSSTVPSTCLEAKPCVSTRTQMSGQYRRRNVWTGSSSVAALWSVARYTWSVRGRVTKHSQT